MTDALTTDLRSVKRLIIRGDGSFNADPKGDWVSARHFDEALAEIERLKKMHEDWFNGPNGVKWYIAENERLRNEVARWDANCTGHHGSQVPCGAFDVAGDPSG